ncbi:MAG: metallophosphoesterase [Planctomycetota bacterium]|nr:metallophosphoesterase [Planctomycetota bacterium]
MSSSWAGGIKPECRVLHLTDIHMTETAETGLVESHGQRIEPIRKRLAAVLEREAHKVDHIIVTGDLTDSGQESEFQQISALLHKYCRPENTTIIPGNHDLVQGTTFYAADKEFRMGLFTKWCRDFLPASIGVKHMFPYARWIGDRTCFIGVDTNGEGRTLYNASWGDIDGCQLERLKNLLDGMPDAVHKIIGMHHSFYRPKIKLSLFASVIDRFFMGMENSEAFKSLLLDYKNVVVTHGHHHLEIIHEEGPKDSPLINLGAASTVIPDEVTHALNYVILEFYDDAVLSVKWLYEDSDDGINVLESVRRRFSLSRAAIPSPIKKVLGQAKFLRSYNDRFKLDQWRREGALDQGTRQSLRVPGFLRSVSDKLALQRKGLLHKDEKAGETR